MIRTGLYPRLPVAHGTQYRAAAAKKRREIRQRQQARQQQANA